MADESINTGVSSDQHLWTISVPGARRKGGDLQQRTTVGTLQVHNPQQQQQQQQRHHLLHLPSVIEVYEAVQVDVTKIDKDLLGPPPNCVNAGGTHESSPRKSPRLISRIASDMLEVLVSKNNFCDEFIAAVGNDLVAKPGSELELGIMRSTWKVNGITINNLQNFILTSKKGDTIALMKLLEDKKVGDIRIMQMPHNATTGLLGISTSDEGEVKHVTDKFCKLVQMKTIKQFLTVNFILKMMGCLREEDSCVDDDSTMLGSNIRETLESFKFKGRVTIVGDHLRAEEGRQEELTRLIKAKFGGEQMLHDSIIVDEQNDLEMMCRMKEVGIFPSQARFYHWNWCHFIETYEDLDDDGWKTRFMACVKGETNEEKWIRSWCLDSKFEYV